MCAVVLVRSLRPPVSIRALTTGPGSSDILLAAAIDEKYTVLYSRPSNLVSSTRLHKTIAGYGVSRKVE